MSARFPNARDSLEGMATAQDLSALDWKRLGEHVKERRELLNMSQGALAREADVSGKTIYQVEIGRVPAGRYPQTLTRIVHALGWRAGSDLDLLNGKDAVVRPADDPEADAESDLIYILRHVHDAGPRTKRAMRAVLEADLEQSTRSDHPIEQRHRPDD